MRCTIDHWVGAHSVRESGHYVMRFEGGLRLVEVFESDQGLRYRDSNLPAAPGQQLKALDIYATVQFKGPLAL